MFLQNSAPQYRGNLAAPGTLLLILVTLMLLAGERMSMLEAAFYDFLQKYHVAHASERIVLVDTASGDGASKFWDIGQFKPVIDALNEAGAALIVPLDEPPANSRLPDIEQLTALAELEKRARKGSGGDALTTQLRDFRQQYEQRAAIADAVQEAGNIVLPIIARPTRQAFEEAKDECRRHAVQSGDGEAVEPLWLHEARGVLTLPDILCKGAANAGYIDYWPDADGIVRRDHLLVKSGQRVFPALSLAVAQAARKNANVHVDGAYNLRIDDSDIDTGPGFSSLIRFYAADDERPAFRSISARDVVGAADAKALFENSIVLLGDLTGGTGVFRTPFGEAMPMPFLVATSLSNLLQMDFISRPYWLGSAELAILLVIGIVILLSAPALSVNRAAVVMLILAAILLTVEAYALVAYGVWLQLVTAALFSVLGIVAIQALSALRPRHAVAASGGAGHAARAPAPHDAEDELDLAFSVLRQQPATDETKQQLYEIAMKHGKQREFAKAERVLLYLHSIDADYRDVREKLKKLSGARKNAHDDDSQADASNARAATRKVAEATNGEQTLGRYIIEKTLGRGAMATVYLGRDPKINRKVAIKTIALAEEFSEDDLDAAKTQFIREAESAGRLNHPNIITIYDTGEDNDVAYLAMEYFGGKALNHYTQAENLLPPKWVLELTARAAEALHYAHGQGVVHRDIKPANLMYDAASDELKITDFGIARLTDTSRTKTGIILGTPSYMSPEQLSASAVTGSSDLYSLGITMYQLLTGTTPFRSDSIPKLMDKIMNERHRPVCSIRDDLPPEIDEVLDKILAKHPEDRYQNGRAMALALRDCCSTLGA